jgi:hypothetical protein
MDDQLMPRREGNRLLICRELQVPPSEAWQIFTDTRLWPLWGPSVQAVECATRYIVAGSRGRIKTSVGLWLPFIITEYQQERSWQWQVGGVRATGHKLTRLSKTRSEICFDMPLWAVFYLPICWLALHRIERLTKRPQKNSRAD